jgi:hypothetical protein
LLVCSFLVSVGEFNSNGLDSSSGELKNAGVVGSPNGAEVATGAGVVAEPVTRTVPVCLVCGDHETTGVGCVALSSLNDVFPSLPCLDRRSGEVGLFVQFGVLVPLLVE